MTMSGITSPGMNLNSLALVETGSVAIISVAAIILILRAIGSIIPLRGPSFKLRHYQLEVEARESN